MAAPRHAQAKRLKKLHLLPAHNGGFIVSHHFHPEHGGTPAPEKHVFKTYPEAHAHLEQTMKAHHHG
jgi:hypothetical protein